MDKIENVIWDPRALEELHRMCERDGLDPAEEMRKIERQFLGKTHQEIEEDERCTPLNEATLTEEQRETMIDRMNNPITKQ
ncbi:hypothetical protein KGP36_06885 [Patescibacteria group bacterium]|nr:hypothetical protein [Patescibacteria group bacterium]